MTPPSPVRPVRRALLSVSDKTGLLEIVPVETLTGSPEMLGGRVKTLHPMVHGGVLARRDHPGDVTDIEAHGLRTIDLVVVNLYPFESTVARADVSDAEAIEQIDIGGPSMIRSAAKNQAYVGVVVDPADYPAVARELREQGELCDATRRRLALEAFERTARYDTAIHAWLAAREGEGDLHFPPRLEVELARAATLRYGENPHQGAALYGRFLQIAEPLHGKELSYNNLVDAQAALALIREFSGSESAAVAILKHNTPCGVGLGATAEAAYRRAFHCDPDSPFGGIIVSSRPCDLALAQAVDEIFSEVLIAPGFDDDALALLVRKKNRRLLRFHPERLPAEELDVRRVYGGLLVQDPDVAMEDLSTARVATQRKPGDAERRALAFAWRVVKHVKSNAVVFAAPDATLAIGGGATARVDAIHQAVAKAARVGIDLRGSALASDAFFPFPDGLEVAAAAGARAVVQPGGSVRDDEVVAAADRLGVAMLLTGVRHFRH
jgi:phosphoribosylaminoimidazolecarboxamide formyltransferase/IMP cyclohydrolase